MHLNRLTERVWYDPFERERDRPNLCYIRGDRWSVAVDAGHSRAHTEEFYAALEEAGLPLPSLTVLTHWHWDHTFGLHATRGLSLANERTNRYLLDVRDRLAREGTGFFLAMDECIRREYAGGAPVVATPADMVFRGEMRLDAGNCPVRVFQAESPHTDDCTLIELPEEGVLFLGDAAGGVFPTWEKSAPLCRKLAQTIAAIGARICLESHWPPESAENTIRDLMEDARAGGPETP